MTIEVASTRLDQSQVINILGGLLDNLVHIVAQRVTAQLTGPVFEAQVKAALDNIDLDSRIGDAVRSEIEAWADNHLDDRLDHWATYKLDIQGDIDRAVRDLDLSDTVEDAVRNLTFEVTVS